MTECTTEQLHFSFCRKRKLTVNFQGGEITSDAGLLLIREADDSLRLTSGIAGSIEDRRDSRYAEHSMGDLLRQRVYQIVAGYEDCNDADLLRKDPALKAACDRLLSDQDLASQPTLSRLENAVTSKDLYRMGEQFLELYIRRNRKRKPKRIILDLDGTDDPTYGNQQLTFFHGYYDQYMYHPLEVYEFYTERGGTCEVLIDEFKNGLKADRLSCHRFLANQFRLFLHMAAYRLVLKLREVLVKTELATMQTARRLWFRPASGYPWKSVFEPAHRRLLADTA